MISDIKNVKDACIPSTRTFITDSEQLFKDSIRYKLVLKDDKLKGAKFTSDDFHYLRNNGGIDVSHESLIIDSFKASQSLKKGSIVEWYMLEGLQK